MRSQSETSRSKEGAATAVALHPQPESIGWKFDWLCEKWSEDAVNFVRRKLERDGVTHVQDGNLHRPGGIIVPRMISIKAGIPSDLLRKIIGAPDEDELFVEGNLLLNEGIGRLLDLLVAAGGVAYNNANAFTGVGDTSTAEAATQTELQAAAAATNRFYKAMNATFPLRPGSNGAQSADWRSDFISSEANFVWNEWTVAAGTTTASGGGFLTGTTNLNRKVQSLGTKTTGTWTLTGTVTIS